MKIVFFVMTLLVVSMIPVAFSQISIDTNQESFSGGDIVKITGSVQGGEFGDIVALEIKNPEGETMLIRTAQIGDVGKFYLNFKIPDSEVSGNYEIIANIQQGGETITETKTIKQSTESGPSVSSDEGGGCLIATATFGSELAPQVQQLREIRDNALLTTTSGTNFMNSFNEFYYSFSPVIADYERENPVFREMVKVTITPMLSSLSLMEYADSESSVVTIGVSLIVLNGLMYFGIPAIVIVGVRKF